MHMYIYIYMYINIYMYIHIHITGFLALFLSVWVATFGVYLGPVILTSSTNLAGKVVINISVSAAGGCLTCSLLCGFLEHSLDVTVVLNGILAGVCIIVYVYVCICIHFLVY